MTHHALATLTTGLIALASQWSVTPAPSSGAAPGTTPPHAVPPATPAHSHTWIVPQMGRAIGRPAISVTDVRASIDIRERMATTTLDISVANASPRAEQAVLLVPVPSDAVVTGFAFEGPASEPTAKLLPRDEARRIYDQIVARERDPALLEWAGWNLLRSSVFPVAPGGTQRVRISWENLLTGSNDRLDYLLPRSDLVGGPPWTIEATIHWRDVAAAYSPSHEIVTERIPAPPSDGQPLRIRSSAKSPGAFRLSIVRSSTPSVSVMTYPDPASGGGYFLLLAAAPDAAGTTELSREVTIVLDRSGSMTGNPFERAKAAILRVLDGFGVTERANLIDFSNSVARFAESPVGLDAAARSRLREYVASLRPGGGTNIHDSLLEALRQPASGGDTVSTILFVTDGVPTIGRTKERDIRDLVERGNASQRRIFVVGLGNDVNVPLLDRIADMTRASAAYLAMDDDLPAKIGELAERLRGPVLVDLAARCPSDPGRVADFEPSRMPDLFRGGTLVVLGRYRGEKPFSLSLEGRGAAGVHRLSVEVDPAKASTANSFVPRLWASRRIAQMVDEIRQLGLDGAAIAWNDPRVRELIGEIVRLSSTWGVLTEYTSMLALEGSNMNDLRALELGCRAALQHRAVETRVGAAAVNQGDNYNRQKWEGNVAASRQFVSAAGAPVESQSMNQCRDKTFYKQGSAWTDASLVGREIRVDEEVLWGSSRHQQLLWQLVEQGRQSAIAMDGEILLQHEGKTIRVCNDRTAP
ncbi:MAG: VWA domain-containing protein [Phycisphaerae bacterium]|nr:VWA domain-containing protein [Phycisphaerae bacterium]